MRVLAPLRQALGTRRGRALTVLVCIGLMLVAGNVIVSRWTMPRFDLTQSRLYTLADGTRHTLAGIDEPITLRFYYSTRLGEAVPAYGVYAQRVRELLDQYAAAANGKIRLEVYNPLPFSDIEDRAVAFGLQSVPLNDQGEAVYFGLAGTNSTDDQQVIAFFNPERERFLEYDLTRLVRTLAQPKRAVVGLMTALPIDGGDVPGMPGRRLEPVPIIEQLRQIVDVETLPLTLDAIPANVDVLMLVHPQDLPETTQFAIDQFVLHGGKALVFVDPYCEMQALLRGRQNTAPAASDLDRLFAAWGVRLLPKLVAGDRLDARRVGVSTAGHAPQAVDYVAWLGLPAANLNRDDVITAELSQIAMASAGILEPVPGATTTFEPLIRTSPDSMKIPVDKVAGLPDVAGLLAGFRPDGREYTLAARITGPAASAFPDGRPAAAVPAPAAGGERAAAPADVPADAPKVPAASVRHSVQPINVVVVADADMLDDRFWAQSRDFFGRQVVEPVANNSDFLANAVEVLAGGSDLVGLRSRGSAARPFVVVERLQRAADARYAAEQKKLQQKLKDTQAKLRSLTAGEGGTGTAAALPAAGQSREIDGFRAEIVTTRRQLRAVQAALRQDIQRLKVILEFFDIALVPIVVVAAAIVVAAVRAPRRRVRARQGGAA